MNLTNTLFGGKVEILANDHFVAVNCDLTSLSALAINNVIKAGTIIPSNDSNAKGVLLHDVVVTANPNGAIVKHGFINSDKLPVAPSEAAITALKLIEFV